ncbi:MAG: 16S rRNA (uracil(1498)-N(3))-methyltransferase [Paracoccaceae bacterium]|nr:16S rRNA (uracil(1498)-N(3))-methyltransferase [Paracoccaceae bacterium]
MASLNANIRLHVEGPLGVGERIPLTAAQSHYLFSVMRCRSGTAVHLFNGSDGEWQADVTRQGRKSAIAYCLHRTAPQRMPPDLWLLFAPITKARTDFIVEKATELGVRKLFPIRTAFTPAARLPVARLQAHAIEAAEQCLGTWVPPIAPLQPLLAVLDNWPDDRRLMFCDERCRDRPDDGLDRFDAEPAGKWAILIGPAGGFSADEAERVRRLPASHPVSLGPRLLRADTAAVAAITLWQNSLGDWRRGSKPVPASDPGIC